MPAHLFQKNSDGSYTEDQKRFAVTLYACSKKAFEQVRSELQLPCPRTIQRWLSHVDGSPGILSNAVDYLGNQLLSK